MNHSFLTVRGLDYSIDGTEILQDVSLEVPEGTFVGLIGPNGCGKSTLLKNIYKTYRPQKDTVYIDGKDVVSLSAKEMARQAAVVAQENQTEFDLEVLDMVMYGRYAHREVYPSFFVFSALQFLPLEKSCPVSHSLCTNLQMWHCLSIHMGNTWQFHFRHRILY